MKSLLIVLGWIFLIILIVFIFPKTCGSKYLDQVINSNIEYKCFGFPGPNLSEKYNWCYGICSEKSEERNPTKEDVSTPKIPIISGMISSFKKPIKSLAIIVLIIGIILAIQKFKKVGKDDNVVYSNRMK